QIPLSGDATWARTAVGNPDLSAITSLEIHQDTWDAGFTVYYNGLSFSDAPGVPSVTLGSPDDGATVSGTVTVTADASSPGGVSGVEFSVDGSYAGADRTAPYTFSWDTRGLAGTHTLVARAYDLASGTVGVSASHSVTVIAPPAVSVSTTSLAVAEGGVQ